MATKLLRSVTREPVKLAQSPWRRHRSPSPEARKCQKYVACFKIATDKNPREEFK